MSSDDQNDDVNNSDTRIDEYSNNLSNSMREVMEALISLRETLSRIQSRMNGNQIDNEDTFSTDESTDISDIDELIDTSDVDDIDELTNTSDVDDIDELTDTSDVDDIDESTDTSEIDDADEISNNSELSNTSDTEDSNEDTEDVSRVGINNINDEDSYFIDFAASLSVPPNVHERHEVNSTIFTLSNGVLYGLNETDINYLPTKKYTVSYSKVSNDSSNKRVKLTKQCTVCRRDFEYNDNLLVLPCFHEFHEDCIRPWLLVCNSCPYCRLEIHL